MSKEQFKVNPVNLDQTINTIIDSIDKGYKLQKLGSLNATDEERLEYSNSLILKPDYQREYRASQEDESSLIESVLVGIPIPPVFLCSSRYKEVQVLNVVDGQHRLFAFYRFRKGEFALKGLQLLDEYEGMHFDELPIEAKEELVGHKLPAYVFKNFPGKKFELEVFNRYNKGTKALTPQEIRNAVYASPYNDYVNSFADECFHNTKDTISIIYNVTKDRFLKKKVHEGIFTVLYVLENGINKNFKDSITYATEYMKLKADYFNANDEFVVKDDVNKVISRFNEFNDWLKACTKITPYPLSKELYGISSKSYKFQTSMALIVPALYKKIYLDNPKKDKVEFDKVIERIRISLNNSFLEKADYSVSSTNSKEIDRLIEAFDVEACMGE